MNGQIIADAIAGGLGGLSTSYENEKRQQDAERLAEMRGQVQAMIASIGATSRENVAGTRADASTANANTRADASRDVAGTNADARTKVANINQAGANGRTQSRVDFGYDKLAADDARGYYGIDARADSAAQAETGRNTRAATSDATRRRGQDFNFTLGTDRNAVTERGQDINQGLGNNRNTIANQKSSLFDNVFGQSPAGTAPAGGASVPAAIAPVNVPPVPVASGLPGGGGAAPSTAAAPVRSALPVTPRGAAPTMMRTPKVERVAPNPKALDLLTQQATATLNAYKAETDPAKKQQLQAQLADLKKRRDAIVGPTSAPAPPGGGGGDDLNDEE